MTEQEANDYMLQIQALAPHYHMQLMPGGSPLAWIIIGYYDEAGGSPHARREFALRTAQEAHEILRQLSGPTTAKSNGKEHGELL